MKIFRDNLAKSTQRELYKRLYAVPHWDITNHMYDRMAERGYTFKDVENVVDNGTLVEYHDDAGTDRIVVEVRESKVRVSIVVDLTTQTLITLYVRDNGTLGRNNKPYLGS